ncbi:hypothetical protein SUGI_0562590 [Cryptomeria japonica]|nr:hypothetical protein SUGI_0562590 [Cryptomeria japonica]
MEGTIEKNLISIAREVEKLRVELTNSKQRAWGGPFSSKSGHESLDELGLQSMDAEHKLDHAGVEQESIYYRYGIRVWSAAEEAQSYGPAKLGNDNENVSIDEDNDFDREVEAIGKVDAFDEFEEFEGKEFEAAAAAAASMSPGVASRPNVDLRKPWDAMEYKDALLLRVSMPELSTDDVRINAKFAEDMAVEKDANGIVITHMIVSKKEEDQTPNLITTPHSSKAESRRHLDDKPKVEDLGLNFSSSGSDDMFGSFGIDEQRIANSYVTAIGCSRMDEACRQKLHQLEAITIEYRETLEECGTRSVENPREDETIVEEEEGANENEKSEEVIRERSLKDSCEWNYSKANEFRAGRGDEVLLEEGWIEGFHVPPDAEAHAAGFSEESGLLGRCLSAEISAMEPKNILGLSHEFLLGHLKSSNVDPQRTYSCLFQENGFICEAVVWAEQRDQWCRNKL